MTSVQVEPRPQGQRENSIVRAMRAAAAEVNIHEGNNSSDEDEDESENNFQSNGHIPCHEACSDSKLCSCAFCGALPMQKVVPALSNGILFDDVGAWDWDGGLYDLVRVMNGQDAYAKVSDDLAKATVEATKKHLQHLKSQLMNAGVQKHMDQRFSGESLSSARVLAPFDISEIEMGRVLGLGGFSAVLEVVAFHPQERLGRRKFHSIEQLSREYLREHAQLHPDDKVTGYDVKFRGSTSKSKNGPSKQEQKKKYGLPYPRYAVKHLRNSVSSKSDEKFKRAAIDIVLEGQLLLVLDHPNIISIRGWATDGPDAFASGYHRDYFLILDKLPMTLEERLWEWRQKLVKYKRRWKRRTSRRKSHISMWVRKRLRNKNEGEPKPPPPDKYALKMLSLLLERLKCATAIASAIAYMHSKRLIHRDLKSSNIGFDARDDVKLFDLGLSRLLPAPDKIMQHKSDQTGYLHDGYVMSRVGTKFYMAPEIRRKEPYNLSADVYSYGIVLWELLTLSSPRDVYHQKKTKLEQLAKRSQGGEAMTQNLRQQMHEGAISWLPVCPCWPDGLQTLITSCLANSPSSRPSMDEVHDILQDHVEKIQSMLHSLQNTEPEVVRRRSTFRIDISNLNFLDLEDQVSVDPTASLADAFEVSNSSTVAT